MGYEQERNRFVVYRVYEEIWNKGNLYAINELIAENFTDHTLPTGAPSGREGYRQLVTNFRNALPDLTVTVESLLSEENRVAVRLNGHGTHHGAFLGNAPTHKPMTFSSITFFTLRDGRLTDRFGISDVPSILQQYGGAVEENKKLVRSYYEDVWTKGNINRYSDYFAPDVIVKASAFPVPGGKMPVQQFVGMLYGALPGMKVNLEMVFGEGDRVTTRVAVSGHHTGSLLFGMPATGKPIEFTGIESFRIANGKFVEYRSSLDIIRVLQQLGMGG